MEFRHFAKTWRIGEPKSSSGYKTILLTEEAIRILKDQNMNLYVTTTEDEKQKEIELVADLLSLRKAI